MSSSIEWFMENICSTCKDRLCEKRASGLYTDSWDRKVVCLLAYIAMLQTKKRVSKRSVKK